MSAVAGYTFVLDDPRDSCDEEIAEGVELSNALRDEFYPEEPRSELATAIASNRATPARYGSWRVRVRSADGLLVAGTSCWKDWEHDTNPDVGRVGHSVRSGHRGKGIGTALLAWEVAFAQSLGQSRLLIHTDSRIPAGDEIAAALGAQIKAREHENRLLLADVDVELLRGWANDDKSAEYELLAIDSQIPDELAEDYVALVLVMNTAPRDDLQVNDFTYSVAQLREGEAQVEKVGAREWTLVVRHRESGDLVGVHTLYFAPDDRKKTYVGITGVVPAHRGHGFGRLLKATLTLRLLTEHPEVECVVTGNADSNTHMLAINEAMGYRPHASNTTWEISRAQLEQWLAARGVDIPTEQAAQAVMHQRAGKLVSS